MEIYDIAEECFNWCKDQYIGHERNLQIQDQTFIIIALIAFVLYDLVSSQWDNIISSKEIKEENLEKVHTGLRFLMFIMLIMHLVYVIIK